MNIKIYFNNKSKEIEIIPENDLATQIFNIFLENFKKDCNIFIFIKKEIYENLPKDIVENIDEFGEDKIDTLEELMAKRVLFIRINNISDIEDILNISDRKSYVKIV